jgi:hypothetical protein
MPQLPTEIILQVIDNLVDFGSVRPVAIDIKDVRTRLLYSLLTVCRTVHSVAKRHLWTACMYIDSPHRLSLLLRSLDESPFSFELKPLVTNLYLSPYHGNIDNVDTASNILKLFTIVGPSLKRLVSNIPLRSLYPEEDEKLVRPVLRRAHMQLINLEEFTSVRDDLFLSTKIDHWNNEPEPEVWTLWPKLRRLALYNVLVSDSWAEDIKKLEHLETLALTRADGLAQFPLPHIFVKRDKPQNLRLLIINESTYDFFNGINNGVGATYENSDGVDVVTHNLKEYKGTVEVERVPITIYAGLENSIRGIQRRVRDAALEDTLWAGEGWWTSIEAARKYKSNPTTRWLY